MNKKAQPDIMLKKIAERDFFSFSEKKEKETF